jgi:hypothetical protein
VAVLRILRRNLEILENLCRDGLACVFLVVALADIDKRTAGEKQDMSGKAPYDMYYPLRLAARFCPVSSTTGRHPHVAQLYRWVRRGLLAVDGTRVFLRAKKRGRSLTVTRQDLEDFFEATSGGSPAAGQPTVSEEDNILSGPGRRGHQQAKRELEQCGF